MDNEIFRTTYREINERFCAYEKSLLTNNCTCSQADRFCIAEREGVRCGSAAGQKQCLQYLNILRRQSRFALRSSDRSPSLPHGKAMRIQVGGLRGLLVALEPSTPVPGVIVDIYGVISAARERFGTLDRLPYQIIIQQIAAFRGRPRSRHKRR